MDTYFNQNSISSALNSFIRGKLSSPQVSRIFREIMFSDYIQVFLLGYRDDFIAINLIAFNFHRQSLSN
jgi:hypothetical protein